MESPKKYLEQEIVLHKFSSMTWKRKTTDNSIEKPRDYRNRIGISNSNPVNKIGIDSHPHYDDSRINDIATNLKERSLSTKKVPVESIKTEVSSTQNFKTELNIKQIPSIKHSGKFFKKIKPGSEKYYEFYVNDQFLETAYKILASINSTENKQEREDLIQNQEYNKCRSSVSRCQEVGAMEIGSGSDIHRLNESSINSPKTENGAKFVANQNFNPPQLTTSCNVNTNILDNRCYITSPICHENVNKLQIQNKENKILHPKFNANLNNMQMQHPQDQHTRPNLVQYVCPDVYNNVYPEIMNNNLHVTYPETVCFSIGQGNVCETTPPVITNSFQCEQKSDDLDKQNNYSPMQTSVEPNVLVYMPPVHPLKCDEINRYASNAKYCDLGETKERMLCESETPPNNDVLNTNAPPFIPRMYHNVAPNNLNSFADMVGTNTKTMCMPTTNESQTNLSSVQSIEGTSNYRLIAHASEKEKKPKVGTGYVLNRKVRKSVDVENRIDLKAQIKGNLEQTLNDLDAQRLNSMRFSASIPKPPTVPVVCNMKADDLNNNQISVHALPDTLNKGDTLHSIAPLVSPITEPNSKKSLNTYKMTDIRVKNNAPVVHSFVTPVTKVEQCSDPVAPLLWNYQINSNEKLIHNTAPCEMPPSPMFQTQVHLTKNQYKPDSITINIEDDVLLNLGEQVPVKPILKSNQVTENSISFSCNVNDYMDDEITKKLSKKVTFTV